MSTPSWIDRLVRGAAAGGLMLVLAMAVVGAEQNRSWLDPYDHGVDAFKQQHWQDAIVDLEKAIAADPRQEAAKRADGVTTEAYFPYYYLGVAYLRIGNFDKAEQNFKQAETYGQMTTAIQTDLHKAESDLQAARFHAIQSQAEQALATKHFPEAVQKFNELRVLDSFQYQQLGLEAKRLDAMRPSELVRQGNAALSQNRLADAQGSFAAARELWPASPGARDGLQLIATRRTSYDAAKRTAEAASTSPAEAVRQYEAARQADPEQFKHDNLDARLEAAQHAMTTPPPASHPPPTPPPSHTAPAPVAAPVTTPSAPVTPPAQPTMSGPPPAAPPVTAASPPASSDATSATPTLPRTVPPLHDAVVAFLEGRSSETVTLLLPSADDASLDAVSRAQVHAYLAVAYADQALEARKTDDREQLRQKALAEFRVTLSVDPNFQLPPRLVSPKIRELLDAARPR